MKQFLKFALVGSVGFLVDALFLYICVYSFALNIPLSRLISFLIAVFVTWFLNRNFTFSKNNNIKKRKEYSLYLIIQTIGAMLNYLIFILLINSYVIFKSYLIVPLAIASIIAMFFNFFMIKKKVYI